ncbi:MAG TPA: hypothetical protein VF533_09470 [Solirubrobacteraceae bacterium]|jgi:hypothetical protein
MSHLPQPSTSGTLAALGRRVVAGLVLVAVALLALKIIAGFVIGLVTTVLTLAAVIGLVVVAIWAYRRL